MPNTTLFENSAHSNILLDDFGFSGLAVQANQHVIMDHDEGMILDPGGHKVYSRVLAETFSVLANRTLRYVFLSHQDPDIVAASNGWLMTTDADAYISALWVRFVPHFGLDRLVSDRLKPIPDEGMVLRLGETDLLLLPAHFLHSSGNVQVYDPTSRVLYTGDLGASLGVEYTEVGDFDNHIQYMEGFHQRYMPSGRALKAWVGMVRELDIEIIAPQHGALFRGPEMVGRFLDWCEGIECGMDRMDSVFRIPTR